MGILLKVMRQYEFRYNGIITHTCCAASLLSPSMLIEGEQYGKFSLKTMKDLSFQTITFVKKC